MHSTLKAAAVVAGILLTLSLQNVFGSYNSGPERESEVLGNFDKPAHIDFKDEFLGRIKVPAGFKVSVFAKGMGHTRTMIEGPNGTIIVSDPNAGDIYSVSVKSDGTAGEKKSLVTGVKKANGMFLAGDKLYFVATHTIYSLDLKQKGARPQVVFDSLPDGGQHGNRVIHLGKDGYLYVSVGSTCNDCNPVEKDSATLQRMKLDGSDRSIVAKGLRDTMAFDWQPATGALYGVDNGVDWRGDQIPPEKLNLIRAGGNYGWPFCWGDKKPDPNLIDEPEGTTKAEYCRKTEAPLLTFSAHSAPIDLKFYEGAQFPADFKDSAFVSMHGSWNRKHPSGYRVLRVVFKDGKPVSSEDFMSGFLSADGSGAFGRPAGLLIDKDGSLLVSDDEDGVIYRVSYAGAQSLKSAAAETRKNERSLQD